MAKFLNNIMAPSLDLNSQLGQLTHAGQLDDISQQYLNIGLGQFQQEILTLESSFNNAMAFSIDLDFRHG